MDLESATKELYGLAPTEFTAARDAKVSEARQTGCPELASKLKKLRKPSVGAWLANVLVLEQSKAASRRVVGIDPVILGGDQSTGSSSPTVAASLSRSA
jgi:hypothetical protein